MSSPKTTIQAAPTTPAPDPGESAEALYQARLQYDPLVAQMEQQLMSQYAPQQAALQAQLYQQYAPQLAGLQEAMRAQYSPQQMAITQQQAGIAQQRLASPFGYTPGEEEALGGIRERQRRQLQEQIRTRAQLGGGLYGGRAQAREETALTELEQAFATEDIGRRLTGADIAMRWAMPSIQQLYPQTTYPGAPAVQQPVTSPVTPGADTLYQAMFQAGQPELYATQSPDYLGSLMGMTGMLGGGYLAGR